MPVFIFMRNGRVCTFSQYSFIFTAMEETILPECHKNDHLPG